MRGVLSPFLPQGKKKGSNRQVAPADIKFYLDCHYSDCMSFAGKALWDFFQSPAGHYYASISLPDG